MKWNDHSKLRDKHSFLSPSKFHWLNYSPERLIEAYNAAMATQRGVALHAFAEQAVLLGQKLPRSNKTLNLYVNDAIGFHMDVEKVLYYSENCFGTADAICFRNNFLRIHDLKTGETPAHMEQLLIYAAIFCLEYKVDPFRIENELRIYQSNEVTCYNAPPEKIQEVMDLIVDYDIIIQRAKDDA